jgi:hypothetical protein
MMMVKVKYRRVFIEYGPEDQPDLVWVSFSRLQKDLTGKFRAYHPTKSSYRRLLKVLGKMVEGDEDVIEGEAIDI